MLDIRIIGTGIEIEKALDCLKQNYQIGSISELYPANHGKFRCYLRAAHRQQCKLCKGFDADESIGLCSECLAAISDEI